MKKFIFGFVVWVIAALVMFGSAVILGVGQDSLTYIPVAVAFAVAAVAELAKGKLDI